MTKTESSFACALALAALTCSPALLAATACTGQGVELQVLGSGGPELQTKRASSSYLIWQDGKARVLVDAGGGSALRFGESGAVVADLDVVLFSHLHVDHTADFPALIKSSYFEDRKRTLPVYGPPANDSFPSTTAFLSAMFDPKRGAFRYLGNFTRGNEGGYRVQGHDVKLRPDQTQTVWSNAQMKVSAARLVHGGVPALAWRVDVGGKSVVFSGDTNGEGSSLTTLAKEADLFVAHNAVPEGVQGAARKLHMPPSVIGEIAGSAGVKQLVLSHRMLRALGHEAESKLAIEKSFHGALAFADDLDCFKP